jgi:hypothetical protein
VGGAVNMEYRRSVLTPRLFTRVQTDATDEVELTVHGGTEYKRCVCHPRWFRSLPWSISTLKIVQ